MNLLLLYATDFTAPDSLRVRISGRRFEHLKKVLDVKMGSELKIGLCNGNMGRGVVTAVSSSHVELAATLDQTPPPPLPLTLICALPRPKSLKKALSTATSLGIKKMIFIESWRVEKSYWQSPVLLPDSIEEHVTEGLEQARDTMVPEISFRNRFKPFVEDELPGIVQNRLSYVAHPYNAEPCPTSLPPHKEAVLVIGPEGGFIPYEIDVLKNAGCIPVTIGERILRVETAIAAFAGRFW